MDKITKPLHKDDIPENKDPGPYWDPSRPLQNRKTRTWDPTKTGKLGPDTLVGPKQDPTKTGKPEPRTLVGPNKNWNAGY